MKTPTLPTIKPLATIQAFDLDGKLIETYEVFKRTFFASTLKVESAVRKRINKDFLHSNTLLDYKFALRIKSTGGTLGYYTKEEAIRAGENLAQLKKPKVPLTKQQIFFGANILAQLYK